MQVPLHPSISHIPMVLAFLVPVFIIAIAALIKAKKMTPGCWLIVIGLQMFTTGTGYYALETGEDEEHTVAKVMSKKYINEHEEAAEIFVGSTVVTLALSVGVFFMAPKLQYPVQIAIALVSLSSVYLAYQTGKLGGELVYVHGAGKAYESSSPSDKGEDQPQGILPTPGMNTSESPLPVDEGDSSPEDEEDGSKKAE